MNVRLIQLAPIRFPLALKTLQPSNPLPRLSYSVHFVALHKHDTVFPSPKLLYLPFRQNKRSASFIAPSPQLIITYPR